MVTLMTGFRAKADTVPAVRAFKAHAFVTPHCRESEGSIAAWLLLHPKIPTELLVRAIQDLGLLENEDGPFTSRHLSISIVGHPSVPEPLMDSIIERLNWLGYRQDKQSYRAAWKRQVRNHLYCYCEKHIPNCLARTVFDASLPDDIRVAAILESEKNRSTRNVVMHGGMTAPAERLPEVLLLGIINWLMPNWLQEKHPSLAGMPEEWVAEAVFTSMDTSSGAG